MNTVILTNIICFDEYNNFVEKVITKFSDTEKYKLATFHNKQTFVDYCEKMNESEQCNVAIIGCFEQDEAMKNSVSVVEAVKAVNPKIGVVAVVPPEKMDLCIKRITSGVDDFIPQNNNAVTRVHNSVKKIISQYNVAVLEKYRNRTILAAALFVLLMIFAAFVLHLSYPQFF